MSAIVGGIAARDQGFDQARRVFGDQASAELARTSYDIAVLMADHYDSENP